MASASPVEQPKAHKVLLVDDHPLVRAGLASVIQTQADLIVCGEAGSAREALDRVRELRPDVAILDLNLPDGSGLDLARRISRAENAPHLIICSIHDANLFAPRALSAGAQGYIHKQQGIAQVIAAIRRVLSGGIYLSPDMTQQMLRHLTGKRETTGEMRKEMASVADLSDRELEVLQLIGDCLSASQIAERLHLSVKTIETHRAKIKRKLNLSTSGALTRYAVQWALEQQGDSVLLDHSSAHSDDQAGSHSNDDALNHASGKARGLSSDYSSSRSASSQSSNSWPASNPRSLALK